MWNKKGMSLVEMAVAILIGSLVVSGTYRAFHFFLRNTRREYTKVELQRDIVAISELLEKDIRMAGYGLPGNGIMIPSTGTKKLEMFINRNQKITTLGKNASSTDTIIEVKDASGIQLPYWICICDTDTVYKEIETVTLASGGNDLVELTSTIGIGTYDTASAVVYFAEHIYYTVTSSPSPQFTRTRNCTTITLSPIIDTITVIPRDKNGANLIGPINTTRSLITILGGKVGQGATQTAVIESTEVTLRNWM